MIKTKEYIYLLSWDEVGGEASAVNMDESGDELTIPMTCNDDELVAYVRAQSDDEEDPTEEDDGGKDWLGRPNVWGWRCASVMRGPNTATIEWRSDRNHLAVTMVVWFA
ncbi:MAG: hypothetical protein DRQ40_04030 [Gammaproteobacteria bacterium]|nr:MAG: hypothetical protein DRQ40_04030 [Gammaproteobacteria bacterium]